LEKLKTELHALEGLLPYLSESRRNRVMLLIDELERQTKEHPLNNVVVMAVRKETTPRKRA
jgi:hypothetical protein